MVLAKFVDTADLISKMTRKSLEDNFTAWCWGLFLLTTTFALLEAANRSFFMGRLNYPAIAAYYLAIVFFILSKNLDRNFRFSIDRLAQRNVVHFRSENGIVRKKPFSRARGQERLIWNRVEQSVERWAFFGAFITAFFAVAPWTINFWIPKVAIGIQAWKSGETITALIKLAHLGLHVVLLTTLSLLIGGRLGKMMYYCWRGARLHKINVSSTNFKLTFNPQPTHPDGMGGAKPLGEFYFYCATRIFYLLMVFIISLVVLLLYPWGDKLAVNMSVAIQFSAGFIVAVILYVVLLIWPLLSIRRQLDNAKKEILLRVDVQSRELAEYLVHAQKSIDAELDSCINFTNQNSSKNSQHLETFQLAASLRQDYISKVEDMHTLPMSGHSWIRYAVSGLTVPFVIYVTWERLIKLATDLVNHAP